MNDTQQLIKKRSQGVGYQNIYPLTYTELVSDKQTGELLPEILSKFNFLYLAYASDDQSTRLQVEVKYRRKGLWIAYVRPDNTLITEYYLTDSIDDESWADSSNWSYTLDSNFQIDSSGRLVYIIGDKTYVIDIYPSIYNKFGSTADRPINDPSQPIPTGFQYFDTTLNKLIIWNGNAWVDASGYPADILREGTTEQRPTGVQIGFIYKDTTIDELIVWNGTEWIPLYGGIGPSDSDLIVNVIDVDDIGAVFTRSGVIYRIYEDINLENGDLEDSELYIPENCVIEFQGGRILGGTIILNNTLIRCDLDVSVFITGKICGKFRRGQRFWNATTEVTEVWDGVQWVDLCGTPIENPRYLPCSGGDEDIQVRPTELNYTSNGGEETLEIITQFDWEIS